VPFPMKSRFDAALRLSSAVIPSVLAAAGATSTSTAAHDLDLVRTVGAGFSAAVGEGGGGGVFRALDLLVAAPALLLPLGTRALRGGLASALVTGICGALAFDLARELVTIVPAAAGRLLGQKNSPGSPQAKVSPRLVSAVSAVAVLTVLLGPAWQSEAASPGGAVTGALLVLLALRLGIVAPRVNDPVESWIAPALLVLGLSASYEPLVFLASLAALAPRAAEALWRARGAGPLELDRRLAIHGAAAFALGLVPLALGFALLRRPPEIAVLGPPVFALVERSGTMSPASFASTEIGVLLLAVCFGGAALSLYVADARRIALPLVLVAGVGALAIQLHAPSGPDRFAAPVLAGLLAAFVLGGTMLGTVVLAIARARVPFAEASAALVVVLELVLPVRSIDETTTRRDARAAHASAIWTDIAWGSIPPAAVVLVADRGTMRRVASARATGEMRGDLVMVPAYDVQGREGQHALLREPKLAPLYRDMALGVAPEELSLAQLGAQRAVLASFDPKWDRSLSRHLVPNGLSSRFEPEPRGSSDRKRALDGFLPAKDRLVRISVAKKDAELAAATAALLRARAIGMAATGERDMLSRALDDLRAFAPDDPVGATLVRRIVTTRGPIDVRDLKP
ncbi:MAG: hypothetical protein K0S65_4735, partial [Labilithrix sp.]|nr:hypothetical protein [Labilithrix sp.]